MDTQQIIMLLNLYALAVDTQRWELFDRVFTPDVDADYPPGLHWTDLESFKRDFAMIHAPLDASVHTITNHQVIVDGDRAQTICYGHWRLIRGDFWEGCGWCDDQLVRTAAGWRINKRVVRMCWSGGNPAALAPLPGDAPPPPQETLVQESVSMVTDAKARKIAYVEKLMSRG